MWLVLLALDMLLLFYFEMGLTQIMQELFQHCCYEMTKLLKSSTIFPSLWYELSRDYRKSCNLVCWLYDDQGFIITQVL